MTDVHEHLCVSPSVFLSLTARQTLPVENTVLSILYSLYSVYSITWEIFIYMCTVGRDIISYIIYCLASPHSAKRWTFAVNAQRRGVNVSRYVTLAAVYCCVEGRQRRVFFLLLASERLHL